MKAVHSLSIAYLVPSAEPGDRALHDQVEQLRRRRIRVSVFAIHPDGRAEVVNRPSTDYGWQPRRVRRVPGAERERRSSTLSAAQIERSARWIVAEATQRQVAHLHACGSTAVLAVARRVAQTSGIGFSCSIDASSATTPRQVLALLGHLADARFIAVPHRADATWLQGLNAELASRVHVVPDGIDLRDVTFPADRREPTGRILCVADVDREQPLSHVIEHLPFMDDEGRTATMTIVEPPKATAAFRKRVGHSRFGSRVRLIPAAAAEPLETTVSAYDAVIWMAAGWHARSGQAFRAVLHAMAAGVPVIHVTPESHDLIRDGRSGFVIAPDAPDRLVEAMRTALWNDAVRRRIVRAARRRVDREYNVIAGCERMRRLFAEAAGSIVARAG